MNTRTLVHRKKLIGAGALALWCASLAHAFDQSHSLLTDVMKNVNDNGLVDYKSLKADPQTLNDYLSSLGAVKRADFNTWTNEQQIAYWINAYNAYTLRAIIDHYPIKSSFIKSAIYPKNSIRQIDGVWDEMKWPVVDEERSLHTIEHEILRRQFDEPRIHMALVCAAMSCPPLRGEAYQGKKLNAQLNDQAKKFLNTPGGLQMDGKDKKIRISKIFDWFGKDFKSPDVRGFIEKHAGLDLSGYEIDYLEYDWTLNEKP